MGSIFFSSVCIYATLTLSANCNCCRLIHHLEVAAGRIFALVEQKDRISNCLTSVSLPGCNLRNSYYDELV